MANKYGRLVKGEIEYHDGSAVKVSKQVNYFVKVIGKDGAVSYERRTKTAEVNVFNPSEEVMNEAGWYLVEDVYGNGNDYRRNKRIKHFLGVNYEELVERLIREKYSVSAELAILRQRDTKPDEFNEYFSFCENCKAQAKREINI